MSRSRALVRAMGLAFVLGMTTITAAPAHAGVLGLLVKKDTGSIEQARAAFTRGDFEAAARIARPLAANFEDKYRKETRKVYCAMNANDRAILVSQGEKDAVIGPKEWCEAMFIIAYSQTELGDRQGAVDTMERLVRLSPLRAQFQIEMAFAYRSVGAFDAAVTAYAKGYELAANEESKVEIRRLQALALRGKGWVLIEKKDWMGARRAYLDSLELEPGNKNAESELQFIKDNMPPMT